MSEKKDYEAAQLISTVLDEVQGQLTAQRGEPEDPQTLVEVYFTLESPIERDVLFDKLATINDPVVDAFFAAMMESDEDDFLRSAAAAELARRGNQEAVAYLQAELANPAEQYFFAHAVQSLSDILGMKFYDTLRALWQDPARDFEQRREAMLGMEALDAKQAMQDFVGYVDRVKDVFSLEDELLEAAMLAFTRQQYVAALPALERLHQSILEAPFEDSEERAETAAFIMEGITLLRA